MRRLRSSTAQAGPPPSSLRAADVRFLLPCWPERVRVAGLDPEVAAALLAAGHEVVSPEEPADAVLCDVASAYHDDVTAGCTSVAVIGRGNAPARALRRTGRRGRSWLLVPDADRTALAVPTRSPAARTALLELAGRPTLRTEFRNRLLLAVTLAGAVPPMLASAAVWSRDDEWPWGSGMGGDPGPCAVTFPGEVDRSRVVAVVPDAHRVVKLTRSADLVAGWEGDRRAHGLLSDHPEAAKRAPRLLGAGMHRPAAGPAMAWTAETRAPGRSLVSALQASDARRATSGTLRAVIAWLTDLGATPGPRLVSPGQLAPLARYDPGAAAQISALPGVFSHGDLGSWNVMTDGPGRFTVLDWEDAVEDGPPLWDLLYFMTDVLAQLDGARTAADRLVHARALHRGELASSALLFDALREAAAATGVPDQDIGTLALACWLHHQDNGRKAVAGATDARRSGALPPGEALAQVWLADDELGPRWTALQERCAPC